MTAWHALPRPRLAAVVGDVLWNGPIDHDAPTDADQVIRTQVRSVRRIDLIGLAGGVGCSHVAARLAVLLAHRRGGRVLGVDAGLGDGFTRLTHAAAPPKPAAPATGRTDRHTTPTAGAIRAEAATARLSVGLAALRVGRVEAPGQTAARPQDWQPSVGEVARFFDVVVTDWGHRLPGIDFQESLGGAHAVALVCRAERAAVDSAVSVAAAVAGQVPCLVCAVDVDGVGGLAPRLANRWTQVPVVHVPFMGDPDQAIAPAPVRRAVIGLAEALMSLATAPAFPAVDDPAVPRAHEPSARRALAARSGGESP